MSFYQAQGEIPKKRHTVFSKKNSNASTSSAIYFEELISRQGFSGVYSNLYHLKMPTRLKRVGEFRKLDLGPTIDRHQPYHLKTAELPHNQSKHSKFPNFFEKFYLFYNQDLLIGKFHAFPSSDSGEEDNHFYRNGHFDELLYVQIGKGKLFSQYGEIPFSEGDYIVIPKGTIYQIFKNENCHFLTVESNSPIQTPKRYRNEFGQLLEHSPFCERDIKTPKLNTPKEVEGEFTVHTRVEDGVQDFIYANHPFDVVGWDGGHYPWTFNINNFEPIVGRIHQPPSVHQTFEGNGFVICSFVSRPFDFHPEAIPAPYPHQNVDSDEILFYSYGDFMSRKGIFAESITYHPMGLAHGPHPGKYEGSIGKKSTEELAVMIDTFRPLKITKQAMPISDQHYPLSWLT